MSNITSSTTWNATTQPDVTSATITDAPSIAPTPSIPTPLNTTTDYYAPSVSQIVVYSVITAMIVIGIAILNRLNPRVAIDSAATNNTTTANDANTSQNQVDLVKSMTPEERKEYVTHFLRTQKFVDNHDQTDESSVSFRVTKSSSLRFEDCTNGNECAITSTDIESNLPLNTVPTTDKGYPGCAICLERFRHGEDICSAQNTECPHEFHLACLFPWLLKSQDCPCCRRDYLTNLTLSNIESADAAEIHIR